MASRERRPWTAEEDKLLRAAVMEEEPGNPNPSKWFAIATHVPGRTNKDCRKRWFARMAADIVRGVWSAEEDAKLMSAVEKHGTKWSLVATMVHSRNSDQCAKRWTDTLDPTIDRSGWSSEQDRILIDAVNAHGTCWKKIVRTYFPGKTGLSAKNRYTSLTRTQIQGSSQTSRRTRSKDDDVHSSTSSQTSTDRNTPIYNDEWSHPNHSQHELLTMPEDHSGEESWSIHSRTRCSAQSYQEALSYDRDLESYTEDIPSSSHNYLVPHLERSIYPEYTVVNGTSPASSRFEGASSHAIYTSLGPFSHSLPYTSNQGPSYASGPSEHRLRREEVPGQFTEVLNETFWQYSSRQRQ